MDHRAALIALAFIFLAADIGGAQEREKTDAGQSGRIVGQILDATTSQPVQDVAVRVVDLDRPARLTNAEGRFEITDLPRGIYLIEIQHIAYGKTRKLVNVPPGRTVELDIRLYPQAVALDSLQVEVSIRNPKLEKRGFYDRRRSGWGLYFTCEDFKRWSLTQVLRRVPLLEFRPGASRFDLTPVFRQAGRYCQPDVYIDGVLIHLRGEEITAFVDASNIEAMEVYRGISTPAEFVDSGLTKPCGAIVIWTRTANSQ
ncbi:MAG TPA: carboxypeptidase regulatory-like domain-containing protein [Longimicrobiales bacterium]